MKKLTVSIYEPQLSRLPNGFGGFTIALVADMHNADFSGRLETEIQNQKPDIIVIVGDLVHKESSWNHALDFVRNAVDIAPT